jgi:hypothetical protein
LFEVPDFLKRSPHEFAFGLVKLNKIISFSIVISIGRKRGEKLKLFLSASWAEER